MVNEPTGFHDCVVLHQRALIRLDQEPQPCGARDSGLDFMWVPREKQLDARGVINFLESFAQWTNLQQGGRCSTEFLGAPPSGRFRASRIADCARAWTASRF